ncbi:MAG: YqgE/AlgH family protein [Puniceicoccales bacterium]|jgi:putative transcriptional regulator|nr:YqgE/AlgH family protein [Puniceicoccales bacterium]
MENKTFVTCIEKIAGTLAGRMLIAHPILEDKQFEKTILFVESDTGNSVTGVILNRPLNIMLKALGKNFENLPISNVPVYQGGPHGNTTVMLTAWVSDDRRKVFEIYHMITPAEAFKLEETNDNIQFRAFLGYCQFDRHIYRDIEKGLWVVGSPKRLLGSMERAEALWKTMLLKENPNALIYQ